MFNVVERFYPNWGSKIFEILIIASELVGFSLKGKTTHPNQLTRRGKKKFRHPLLKNMPRSVPAVEVVETPFACKYIDKLTGQMNYLEYLRTGSSGWIWAAKKKSTYYLNNYLIPPFLFIILSGVCQWLYYRVYY